MHQNAALSVVPSPSARLEGLLKQPPVGSPHGLRDPGFTDVISSSRESTNTAIVSDEKLRIVIADLVDAVRSVLHDEHESAAEYLRRASEALEVDRERLSSKVERQSPEPAEPIPGGLAPWQIRRVTTHIEAHLDETIRNRELATLVRLSSFYFCRAFRESFADSPQWLHHAAASGARPRANADDKYPTRTNCRQLRHNRPGPLQQTFPAVRWRNPRHLAAHTRGWARVVKPCGAVKRKLLATSCKGLT